MTWGETGRTVKLKGEGGEQKSEDEAIGASRIPSRDRIRCNEVEERTGEKERIKLLR